MSRQVPSTATIYLTPSEPLDVDPLVAAILKASPGSRVIHQDYWQHRIDQCEAALSAHETGSHEVSSSR